MTSIDHLRFRDLITNRGELDEIDDRVDLLITLVEQMAGLCADVAALRARVDEMNAIDTEVRRYVLGLQDRLYDLHDAIEDHDNATRPDATVINISHITEED